MLIKNILIGIGVILILTLGFFAFNSYIYNEKQVDETLTEDYKDGTYFIGEDTVRLTKGVSKVESAPGSASVTTTQYFGNEARGDLDNDGDEDVVFLLTQNSGGTGTYFYLVGALKEEKGYRGTRAVLIGDRIAPQTTEFKDGITIVNYGDRKPGEPMTADPSQGKSLYLKYSSDSNDFGEVVQNFEGEADPETMTLDMKTWVLTAGTYKEGEELLGFIPNQKDVFSLTFKTDGTFSATTDCNQVGGKYSTDAQKIVFSEVFATRMFCEGSQEELFVKLLESSTGYQFTSKGQLLLELSGGGSIEFR